MPDPEFTTMNQRSSPPPPPKPGQRVPFELIGPDNFPIAYFNMPKAACTTIKNILYFMQHGRWHADPLAIHRAIRFENVILRAGEFANHRRSARFDRPFTVFSFVRSPGLRAYSTFVEKVWATGEYSFPSVRNLLKANYGYRLNALEGGAFECEDVRQGFKSFLRFAADNLEGKTGMAPNAHWAGQYRRLRKLRPFEHVGFVGRVESFEEDMSFVLRKSGWEDVSIARTRFNEGPKPPFGFNDLLDDEIAAAVSELYEEDFQAFDYKPPLAGPVVSG
jgi:hypothetical protein